MGLFPIYKCDVTSNTMTIKTQIISHDKNTTCSIISLFMMSFSCPALQYISIITCFDSLLQDIQLYTHYPCDGGNSGPCSWLAISRWHKSESRRWKSGGEESGSFWCFWINTAAAFRESNLELFGYQAVDEKVGWEVEHDQEVGHGLQAHDPERGDVLVNMRHTRYLNICKYIKRFKIWNFIFPTMNWYFVFHYVADFPTLFIINLVDSKYRIYWFKC